MRRAIARASLVAVVAVGSWACALGLVVDPTGGPLVLGDLVDDVLADWLAAGIDPDGVDLRVRVRYGDPDRFGPDAIVFVVARPDEEFAFDVLVDPRADGVRAALVPALGVVLGGSLGEGALDPRIDVAAPRTPTAADVLALRGGRSGVEGDVDGDGRVTFEDLLLVAAAFGRQGVNLFEDLDGDGIVGAGDLDVLRERYEFTAPTDPAAPAAPGDPGSGDVEDRSDDDPPDDDPPDEEGPPGDEAPSNDGSNYRTPPAGRASAGLFT